MLNKVFIIGNLTRDPESRKLNNGNTVAKLGMAVNRSYKDAQGNKVDDTTFVDVDVWGKSAEFCANYLRKGSKVMVEGRLKLDSWEDRDTGQQRTKLGVTADSVQNLTPRTPDQGQQRPPQSNQPPAFPGADSIEDNSFM